MSYTPTFIPEYQDGWENLPSEDTPITADALNGYDGAIENIEDYLANNDIVEVEANPAEAATGSLSTINIAGTVYSVSGGGGSSTFAGLSDVDFDNLQNGQVPVYNSTSQKWENGSGGGGSSTLSGLTDVTISSAQNGQVLKYDSTSSKWINAAESGGGGGVVGIASIYTDTERQIGLFSDGRPLYQKSYVVTSSISVTSSWTNTGITLSNEIDRIINGEVYRNTSTGLFSASFNIDTSNHALRIRFASSETLDANSIITIQYTKSSDSPTTLIPSSASAIYMMGDVAISSIADGQILKYDSSSSKWINSTDKTVLTATLTSGSTSLTFSNAAITTTAMYDVYADKYGLTPTNMTVTTGQAVLTFEAQSADVSVKLVIR